MTRRLFLLTAIATALLAEDFSGLVVGVSDGDTVRVLHDGREERVRLWGIDAPESKQPWGTRAKEFTGDLVFGKVVTVQVRDIDRYKRTVAEIILPDGRNPGAGVSAGWTGLALCAVCEARWRAACAGAGSASGETRAVGRPVASAALGVAEGEGSNSVRLTRVGQAPFGERS
jgi:hypothetical protein